MLVGMIGQRPGRLEAVCCGASFRPLYVDNNWAAKKSGTVFSLGPAPTRGVELIQRNNYSASPLLAKGVANLLRVHLEVLVISYSCSIEPFPHLVDKFSPPPLQTNDLLHAARLERRSFLSPSPRSFADFRRL